MGYFPRWLQGMSGLMAGKYDGLSREQLILLLEKSDRTKKLGLIWERDQIEADRAIDANFVACAIRPDLSDEAAPWRNLVIEGDNFDALRWLRMSFAGRVKCIYIDPPYNTGNKDWIYNDHFVDSDDRYRHSTWLEFLYRRLTLARDLLSEDGVMLVSINDDNRARLDMLMDEALPGMRLGSLVWRSRTGGNEGGPSAIPSFFRAQKCNRQLAIWCEESRMTSPGMRFRVYPWSRKGSRRAHPRFSGTPLTRREGEKTLKSGRSPNEGIHERRPRIFVRKPRICAGLRQSRVPFLRNRKDFQNVLKWRQRYSWRLAKQRSYKSA